MYVIITFRRVCVECKKSRSRFHGFLSTIRGRWRSMSVSFDMNEIERKGGLSVKVYLANDEISPRNLSEPYRDGFVYICSC
jgi:hypothetical protein